LVVVFGVIFMILFVSRETLAVDTEQAYLLLTPVFWLRKIIGYITETVIYPVIMPRSRLYNCLIMVMIELVVFLKTKVCILDLRRGNTMLRPTLPTVMEITQLFKSREGTSMTLDVGNGEQ